MDLEWIEERAAILEFEANCKRATAENLAAAMWKRHCRDVVDFENRGGKWATD